VSLPEDADVVLTVHLIANPINAVLSKLSASSDLRSFLEEAVASAAKD
jgi:hypothetical protein